MEDKKSSDPRDRWIEDKCNDPDKKTDFDKWIEKVPEEGGKK
jgi:hypothetical protein